MSVHASIEGFEIKKTGAGSVVFLTTGPTNHSFTATDGSDYDVITLEGDGFLDEGTKTNLGFDANMSTTYSVFKIVPRVPGAVAQVA